MQLGRIVAGDNNNDVGIDGRFPCNGDLVTPEAIFCDGRPVSSFAREDRLARWIEGIFGLGVVSINERDGEPVVMDCCSLYCFRIERPSITICAGFDKGEGAH